MNADNWISVKDRPLFTMETSPDGNIRGWIATEDGDKAVGFIAAVPTNKGWWIRHCVMEDERAMCVVGDNDNEPCGWDMVHVTHYQHLPSPPKDEDCDFRTSLIENMNTNFVHPTPKSKK